MSHAPQPTEIRVSTPTGYRVCRTVGALDDALHPARALLIPSPAVWRMAQRPGLPVAHVDLASTAARAGYYRLPGGERAEVWVPRPKVRAA